MPASWHCVLQAGAIPNMTDAGGATPLLVAASRGSRQLVEKLLPHTNPDVNIPDWSVDAVLQHAAKHGLHATAASAGDSQQGVVIPVPAIPDVAAADRCKQQSDDAFR